MAKKAANNFNYTLNAVAIEDDMNSVSLKIDQETPEVTSFADAGPRRVAGNYDWSVDAGGAMDPAASQGDATIFGMLGNAGVSSALDPTGTTAGTNDPNYDGTVVLGSYEISGANGGAVMWKATFPGTSALARATS